MKFAMICGASALALAAAAPVFADPGEDRIAALEARLEQLEETNRRLLEVLEAQGLTPGAQTAAEPHAPLAHPHDSGRESHAVAQTGPHRSDAGGHGDHHAAHMDRMQAGLVGVSPDYGFAMLDHAEGVNTRHLTVLQAQQRGALANRVTLSGSVTALADYQESNSNTKFGWLMRHPTSANQIGETVSEAVVHNAQLAFTAQATDTITAYAEILYDPEQSFGQGTITDLNRNQLQLRKAWVMWGDLDQSPFYAALGKMDTPFGLNDTVSPFTNSTSWHAFAGLAYGAMGGYFNDGLHVRAMAIQGGAQFRAHNAPVEDTNVPSRLNNFAIDANYTAQLGGGDSVMAGASYTHGTAYCQGYPVFHFNPCDDNNPGWAVYAAADLGPFDLLGEYASTTDVWPGTANPAPQLAQFEAVKAESFTVGGRYWMSLQEPEDFALSAEFSRFIAGDDGAPWERQDQYVLGAAFYPVANVEVFGEYIHTAGWVPLNFLSGGNPGSAPGTSWSERNARTNIIALGVQAAF